MCRHGDVRDPPPLVREDDEHEQHAAGGGRHHEEIRRHDLANVIGQERPPRLRRRTTMSNEVLRDARLTDLDPELPQLAMDSRGAPEGIGLRHRADQRAHFGRDAGPTEMMAALPGPPESERPAMPGNDRVGLDNHESRPPRRPDAGQPHPQEPVGLGQAESPTAAPLQNVELVSQGENLELQRCPGAQR